MKSNQTWRTSTSVPCRGDDWPAVRDIYSEGIADRQCHIRNGGSGMDQVGWRASSGMSLGCARQPADSRLGGVESVSSRRVYCGVAEVSVYVASAAQGCGVGKKLLQSLVEQSEQSGIWTLQAGIFPENIPSIALHKSCGFREVGRRQRLGQRNGVWRDVLLLERRSSSVGV